MQCDICFRTGGSKLPFLCPIDARNQLYQGRFDHAQVLLENDALNQEISALLSKQSDPQEQEPSGEGSNRRLIKDAADSEREQALDRTQQIIERADELRVNIKSAREDIAKRNASIARRKSDMASASLGGEEKKARLEEDVKKSISRIKYKWNKVHVTAAASRAFLCGEAAKLYGLERVEKAGGKEEYKVGGVKIMDLRSLNVVNPAHISTALTHIVHLLMLSTHYLAVRLPAEITLPHRDYPLPTIFPLPSSYKHTDVPFPGSASGQSSSNSPTASRHSSEQTNQPRPRPLFVNKPLPILASEDPSAYALFLEGVSLLAYDITWLCKSQGIPVGEETSFEDICNIGRNLYNLLVGSSPRPQPAPSSRATTTQSTPTKGGEADTSDKKASPIFSIGKYSHGYAHSFLGSAEATEAIRSWKLSGPLKIADKLKSKLMSEAATAEWEVLGQDAWTAEDEMGDDGVVVGARREVERAGMHSFMSMRTVIEAVDTGSSEGERKPGVNGWTKLKPR